MLDLATKHEAKRADFSHTAFRSYSGPTTRSSSIKSSYYFSKKKKRNLFATVEPLSN